VLDLAHLGLGPDGHTASLIPGDPVLNVTDRDIAVTGVYQGRKRMTMTYPVINRAEKIMWLVSGKDKVDAFKKLRAADPSVPAGRIRQTQALLLADKDAAGE
jgi:6-phosphogluconolactonase